MKESANNKLAESKIESIYNKCETYAEVLDFVKRKLQEDGCGGLLKLAVGFKTTDPAKLHVISKRTLATMAPFLQGDHIDLIFRELSSNQNDIDYSVLVYDIKGQVEEDRVREIEGVFNVLDNRREGEFPINYMVSRFFSKSLGDNFQKAIDLYAKFQGIDDGVFTEDDFHDCLGFLSFDYNSNEAFTSHIIRPFYEEDKKSVTSQRSNRSREFQTNKSQLREEPEPVGTDFRKQKDSPLGLSPKEKSRDNFD